MTALASLVPTLAWQELERHQESLSTLSLRDIVLKDPQRLSQCQIALPGLRLNYALNRATAETVALFAALATECKVEEKRARMFSGERVNVTENRAVLHTALRQIGDVPVFVDGKDVIPDIRAARRRMAQFAEDVREGRWRGSSGKPIRHIINLGIGGSDLGPRLAVKALAPFAKGPQVHFVANADAFELLNIVEHLDPAETLFLIVSKTFTTQETMLNARTARRWLSDKLGDAAALRHFVGVTVNRGEADKFGIPASAVFPIWDWIGGRFSLWSAVGLGIMLALGPAHFDAMLDGAAAMDEHFRTAPFAQNMPAMLALLGIWNRDFWGASAFAVLPYSERLREFPRYLQQLEMESNGKSVTRDSAVAAYPTAPVIFGECGTVGQHSFHQWLHQGSDIVPADFIGVVEDDLNYPDHHRALQANMAAQAVALAFGRTNAARPQEIYPGGRPANLILLDRLDPRHFGMLVALYEHKVFTQGAVWNLNSFDQPGVELGKQMARALENHTTADDAEGAFLARLFTAVLPSGSKNRV